VDFIELSLRGLEAALTPQNLLFCLLGAVIGTLIGVIPGLGPSGGIALLLPLTLAYSPLTGLIMLAGIYYGCQYGGTITSVLIATPGEASTAVSVIEGHAMARAGRAGPALAIAAIASFVAGTITIVMLSAAAQLFTTVALSFGPPEYVALVVLGLLTIGGISSGDKLKGWTMAALGIFLSTVGIDSQSGAARFTFDQTNLLGGIGFVEVLIGGFAIREVLRALNDPEMAPIRTGFRNMLVTREDLRQAAPATLRGSVIGFGIGLLPGAGAALASFLDYDLERRVAKDRDRFGQGAISGLAGPEAANNAAANGAFVPTLTLGIPGSGATTVLLGAFIVYGLRPGPLLMTDQSDLVWGLIASFYVGNVMLLLLNLPLAPVFASVLRLRYSSLYPLILVFSFIGAYSIENRVWGVWVALAAGILAYFLAERGYPVLPAVMGLVLGTLFEESLVRTSAMGGGSLGIFWDRPVALCIFGLAATVVIVPRCAALARRMLRRRASVALTAEKDPR
jgi:putative tricarboxylic transport membrane protein